MNKQVLKSMAITMVVLLSPIIIIFLLILWFMLIFGNDKKSDYTQAKKETIGFLNKNEEELEKIALEYLKSCECNENVHSGLSHISCECDEKIYPGVEYISCWTYHDGTDFNSDDCKCVEFEIDSQGMLGGQYWSLIYTNQTDFISGEDLYIEDENKTNRGNNIFITEKIKDNWYFRYEDFDGITDLSVFES